MSWTGDIVILFEDANVGTLNEDIFVSTKQTVPILLSGAATVQIVETSGSGAERTQNRVIRPAYVRPSAQIMTRAGTPALAKAKAFECYDALVPIRNAVIYATVVESGYFYREINPLQEPYDFGVDDRKQSRYVFNVVAIKRP